MPASTELAPSRRTLALALCACPGIGDRTLCRLLDRPGPWAGLTSASEANLIKPHGPFTPGQGSRWADRRQTLVRDAARKLEAMHQQGITLLLWDEVGYPAKLAQRHDAPPALLFAYGNLNLLGRSFSAFLASRHAPPAALTWLEAQAEREVHAGQILVCGHDTPEYQASAIVPLRWGAPRVLVFDTSLDQALGPDLTDEPFRSARLWRYQFDPDTDLALSFVMPGKPYFPSANQKRDRALAALADRLGFGWIATGGNMERLALNALKSGDQEVLMADHMPGTRRWIEMGASLA